MVDPSGNESEPPIWRRLFAPAHITLAKLHRVLQDAMTWANSHLRCFEVEDVRRHGRSRGGPIREFEDERRARSPAPCRKGLQARVPVRLGGQLGARRPGRGRGRGQGRGGSGPSELLPSVHRRCAGLSARGLWRRKGGQGTAQGARGAAGRRARPDARLGWRVLRSGVLRSERSEPDLPRR